MRARGQEPKAPAALQLQGRGGGTGLAQGALSRLHTPLLREPPQVRVQEGTLRLKPRGDKIRSGLATDLWPYVERIEAPTLLLIGEESDLVTPQTQERMENTVPDIEVIKVKGTGLIMPKDRARRVRETRKRIFGKSLLNSHCAPGHQMN